MYFGVFVGKPVGEGLFPRSMLLPELLQLRAERGAEDAALLEQAGDDALLLLQLALEDLSALGRVALPELGPVQLYLRGLQLASNLRQL